MNKAKKKTTAKSFYIKQEDLLRRAWYNNAHLGRSYLMSYYVDASIDETPLMRIRYQYSLWLADILPELSIAEHDHMYRTNGL